MGLFGESVTTLKRGLLEEVGNDTSLHVYEEKKTFLLIIKKENTFYSTFLERKKPQKTTCESRMDNVSGQGKRNTVSR